MRIIYVLGLNRSGSTVFERALGSIDGVFAAGELHNLCLAPGLARRCGCGATVRTCPVWCQVVARLEQERGEPIEAFVLRVAQLHERTGRSRHIANIVRGVPEARELASLMHAFYAAIAAVTGAGVVTDSSKGAAGALLLRLMPVDFTVVELSRDPFATIESNRVTRGWEGVDQTASPPAIAGGRLAATQASLSLATRVLHKHVVPIAFEDFLRDPSRAAARLLLDAELLKAGQHLARTHQCEGNPVRFGEADLRPAVAQQPAPVDNTTRLAALAIAALRRLGR